MAENMLQQIGSGGPGSMAVAGMNPSGIEGFSVPTGFPGPGQGSDFRLDNLNAGLGGVGEDERESDLWREGEEGEDEADTEFECLLGLYHSTGGVGWMRNRGWALALRELSSWAGVTVARASARQAGGPEPLLLESLRLSQNNLSGQLPPLMPFRNLRVLDLSANSLSGTIQGQSFHHLTMCETINLEHNRFSGPLPSAALRNLVNLQVLQLGFNEFTGSIPGDMGAMTNLTDLDLQQNHFTGSIPAQLGNLRRLRRLALKSNPLVSLTLSSEGLPLVLASLPMLEDFDLIRQSPAQSAVNTVFSGTPGNSNFAPSGDSTASAGNAKASRPGGSVKRPSIQMDFS